MEATKRQINKISKYLWKQGHGGKKVLAESLGFNQSEITKLLRDGVISEAKLNQILDKISEWQ